MLSLGNVNVVQCNFRVRRTRLGQIWGHNFNAMAIKLWENLQLSFGDNMIEFDLSRDKYF